LGDAYEWTAVVATSVWTIAGNEAPTQIALYSVSGFQAMERTPAAIAYREIARK
jgi:hypothetical protein